MPRPRASRFTPSTSSSPPSTASRSCNSRCRPCSRRSFRSLGRVSPPRSPSCTRTRGVLPRRLFQWRPDLERHPALRFRLLLAARPHPTPGTSDLSTATHGDLVVFVDDDAIVEERASSSSAPPHIGHPPQRGGGRRPNPFAQRGAAHQQAPRRRSDPGHRFRRHGHFESDDGSAALDAPYADGRRICPSVEQS